MEDLIAIFAERIPQRFGLAENLGEKGVKIFNFFKTLLPPDAGFMYRI
jgi:hypothetical protein